MSVEEIEFSLNRRAKPTVDPSRLEIVWITFGLSWRVGRKVFMNRLLEDRPDLSGKVMHHETLHDDLEWGMKDFRIEVIDTPFDLKMIVFMFLNPSTWLQLSPWIKLDGKWYFERSAALMWVLTFFIILFCAGFYFVHTRGLW